MVGPEGVCEVGLVRSCGPLGGLRYCALGIDDTQGGPS